MEFYGLKIPIQQSISFGGNIYQTFLKEESFDDNASLMMKDYEEITSTSSTVTTHTVTFPLSHDLSKLFYLDGFGKGYYTVEAEATVADTVLIEWTRGHIVALEPDGSVTTLASSEKVEGSSPPLFFTDSSASRMLPFFSGLVDKAKIDEDMRPGFQVEIAMRGTGGTIYPTGYNSTIWSNETNAYDGDTGTAATVTVNAGSWSPYLELTLDSQVSCGKAKYMPSQELSYFSQVDIDVYDSDFGFWFDVYDYSGSLSNELTTAAFSSTIQNVTKARIRFYNDGTSSRDIGVNDFYFVLVDAETKARVMTRNGEDDLKIDLPVKL